tara:strand:+ start:206 stop:655 length:450 start_codon:yes stop_codon:yes gene_type:complete
MQKLIVLFTFITLFCPSVIADEIKYFVMLKNSKVNVRYGPGFDYPIKYVYKKKYLPIKVIDKKENFRRIVDQKNNSGWIHTSQLTKNKSFILLENQILFSKPTKYSKPIAKISTGRLLLIKKCKLKWCKIKTEKYIGWIKTKNIWGNAN